MTFILDPRIEADSYFVCDLELSHVRLHRNAAFPWLMLMPRRAGMVEIIDLTVEDQEQLLREIRLASHVVRDLFKPTKINVANLGNVTPQLHVHVVARFDTDKAWPGPIWNSGVNEAYDDIALQERIELLQEAFK
jgi:diadenosine tetraphosphate (Ap4A) HIT family hydrolase